jgi:hypothetical protein
LLCFALRVPAVICHELAVLLFISRFLLPTDGDFASHLCAFSAKAKTFGQDIASQFRGFYFSVRRVTSQVRRFTSPMCVYFSLARITSWNEAVYISYMRAYFSDCAEARPYITPATCANTDPNCGVFFLAYPSQPGGRAGLVCLGSALVLVWFALVLLWFWLGLLWVCFGSGLVCFGSALVLAWSALVLLWFWLGLLWFCFGSGLVCYGSALVLAWFASVLLEFWLSLLWPCFGSGLVCFGSALVLD